MRTKRRLGVVLLIMGFTLCMSGCSDLKLAYTDEQMDVIADHAAAIVMKHDERLYTRYLEEEETTEKETEWVTKPSVETETGSSSDNTETGESGETAEQATTEQVTEPVVSVSEQLTKALDISGLTAEYLGFSVTSEYPYENKEDALFVMKATKDTQLLSVKFRLSNQSGQDIQVNMMEKNRKYQAVVNDTMKVSAQLTLLLDALNTFEGTIKAGQSEELVLIYQVKLKSEADVKHLDVIFTGTDGKGTKIRLK